MSTAIAFHGGTYGTYLEWCLTSLSSDSEIVLPFYSNGSSHQFLGNHLLDKLASSDSDFVRFHPKNKEHQITAHKLNEACELFDSVIYLYPDAGSILLTLNNFYKKIWKDWRNTKITTDSVFRDNLYQGWGIDEFVSVQDIPIWIQREMLSYNLMPSWFSLLEWKDSNNWSNPKGTTVLVSDLLYDFESTMSKIQQFCNLEFKRSITDLIPAHYAMLSLQSFLGQDQLCVKIVSSVVTEQSFDWENQILPLPSQAWVQWQLRNLGQAIKCDGLDKFPTNSLKLKELLYPI
jgi:hypothetical protein